VLLIAWAMVWAGYLLLDPGGLDIDIFDPATQRLLTAEPESWAGRLVLLVPWPTGYEAGIRYLTDFHASAESPGYLFGQRFTGAPAWFWLGSFVFKSTLVALLVMAAGILAWLRLRRGDVARALLVLVPMAAGLVAMMTFAERPFGVRYLIPIIVIAFAAAGPIALLATRRWLAVALVAVIVIQSGQLWGSHPHTFAWSNPLFRQTWQLAADSNVDWGQDFYRLQAWAAEEDEPVWVSYFGFGPSFALEEIPGAISAHPYNVWGPFTKPPGTVTTYAVSASNLNAFVGERIGLLRTYCPVEVIGETILVYRFEEPPYGGVTLMGPTDGIPVPPCEDEPYSFQP
jgi:hypothetical protein